MHDDMRTTAVTIAAALALLATWLSNPAVASVLP
jgi:hypothetical protein